MRIRLLGLGIRDGDKIVMRVEKLRVVKGQIREMNFNSFKVKMLAIMLL